jgi:hypothetical protein
MSEFDLERFRAELSNIPDSDVKAQVKLVFDFFMKKMDDLQKQIDEFPEIYDLKDKPLSKVEQEIIEKEES